MKRKLTAWMLCAAVIVNSHGVAYAASVTESASAYTADSEEAVILEMEADETGEAASDTADPEADSEVTAGSDTATAGMVSDETDPDGTDTGSAEDNLILAVEEVPEEGSVSAVSEENGESAESDAALCLEDEGAAETAETEVPADSETETYGTLSGTCGTSASWTLTEGTLTITGSGEIDSYVFKENADIVRVEIGDGITGIGSYSFYKCTSLEEVIMENSVTGIEAYAFCGCTALKTVEFSEKLTDIGADAFSGCTGLAGELLLPDSLTDIGAYAFWDCDGLTGVSFGTGLCSIGNYAFSGCDGILTVDLPDNLTTLGSCAFYDCDSLLSVSIGDGLAEIGSSAFSNCDALETAILGAGVTTIGASAFSNCSVLETVTFGKKLTVIGASAFYGCTALTGTLSLPETLESIGTFAFYNCTSLTGTLSLPDGVTTVGSSAFYNCLSLTGLELSDELTEIKSNTFCGCSSLAGEIVIPDQVTTIYYGAFYGCSLVTSFVFGSGLTNLNSGAKSTSCPNAYGGCTGVKTLTFQGHTAPDMGSNSVIYQPFADMTALESVYVPEGCYKSYNTAYRQYLSASVKLYETGVEDEFLISEDGELVGYQGTGGIVTIPENVTSIGAQVFAKNTSVTGVVLPDGITAIGDYAFDGTGLTGELAIPDSVTEIGAYAFRNCDGLTGISLGTGLTTIGNYAFYDCDGLTAVSFGAGLVSIGKEAFYDCDGISAIELPDSLTTLGSYAFYSCGSLSSLTIGGGLTEFGTYSFYSCTALKTVTLGEKFTAIGSYAFDGCTALETVTFGESLTDIGAYAFYGCTALAGTLSLPETLESIGSYAFYNCKSLTGTLSIPDGVTTVGSCAFYNCAGLTGLVLSTNLTEISGNTFRGCSGLTGEIVIPDQVSTIYYGAFYGCGSVTSFTFGSGLTNLNSGAKSTSYPNAYGGCTGVKTLTFLGETVPDMGSTSSSYQPFADMSALEIVYVPEGCYGAYNTAYRQYLPDTAKLYETGEGNDFLVEDGELVGYQGSGGTVEIPENVTSIGAQVFAKNTSVTEVVLHDGITSIGDYAFDGSGLTGTLTIPDSVTEIGAYAFRDCDDLTEISLGAGLTAIGAAAFYDCDGLTAVFFGAGLVSIGNEAFFDCDGISAIELPDGLTTMGSYVFYGCDSLSSLATGDGLTEIGSYSFYSCTVMKTVTLGAQLTTIDSCAFEGCTALETVIFGESLTDIGYSAFDGCTALSGVLTLPETLVSIGTYAFYNCRSLTGTLTIPDSVTTVGNHAFYNCSGLTGLVLSENMTVITGSTFRGCSGLTGGIVIPDQVTAIYNGAFYGCGSVTSFTFGSGLTNLNSGAKSANYPNAYGGCTGVQTLTFLGKSVPSMGTTDSAYQPFAEMSALEAVYVPEGCYKAYNTAYRSYLPASVRLYETGVEEEFLISDDGELVGYQGTGGTVTIPDAVTSIGAQAFAKNISVKGVVLHDGITSIGDYAFDGTGLTGELVLPDSVMKIGAYAFRNCDGLTGVSFGAGLTTIGNYAFYDCDGLTGISFGAGLTTIGNYAFYDCDSITAVDLPDSLTTLGSYAFYSCDCLSSLTTGDGLAEIGSSAFSDCAALETATLGEGLTTIGSGAFSYCTALETVIFGESLISIGASAFYECTALSGTLSLPETLESIGTYAFYNCKSLTGILTIPDGVTTVGSCAFYNCEGLESLKLSENMTVVNGNTFRGCSGLTGEIVIPDQVTTIYYGAFYGCSGVTSFVFGSGLTNLNSGAKSTSYPNAYGGCTGVKTLTFLGESVPAMGTTSSTYQMFSDMTNLETVYVLSDELLESYASEYESYMPEGVVFTSDITASAPGNLTATYVSPARVVLAWNSMNSNRVAGYVIYRDGEEMGRTADGTVTWEDDSVSAGTTYLYEVCGYTSDEEEQLTGKAALTIRPELSEVLTIYTNGCDTDTVAGSRTTLYARVSNTGSFGGYKDAACGGSFWYERDGERILLGEASLRSTNSAYGTFALTIDITDIPEDYYYVYFVYEDPEGNQTQGNEVIFVKQSGPQTITGVAAVNDTDQIILNWGISAEAASTKYLIYRRTGEEEAFSLLARIDSRSTLSYTDTEVEQDQVYEYYVVTANDYGQYSEPSDIVRGCPNQDVQAPTVKSLTPSNGSVLSRTVFVSAAAEDNVEVTSMELQVSTDEGESWNTVASGGESGLTADLDTAVYADGEILVRALAWDGEGNESDGTPVYTYRVDNTGPEQVTGLSCTGTSVTATLYWDDVADEDFSFFRVEQLEEDGWVTVTDVYSTKGVNLYGLTPDTLYTYRVTAYDLYGNRGVTSEEVEVTTLADELAPVILALSPQSGRYAQSISFTATGTDEYAIAKLQIQYSQDLSNWTVAKEQTFEEAGVQQSLTAEIDVETLPEGSLYLRGVAWDFAGNESDTTDSAPYVEVTVDRTAPDVPEGVSVTSGDGYMIVSWTQGEEEDLGTYDVYRSTDGESFTIAAASLSKISYIDRSVETGTEYYYKVCVRDTAGNVSGFSETLSGVAAPDTEAPVIQSVSPADGSSFAGTASTLQVKAAVTDNRLISRVRFYQKDSAEGEYSLFSAVDVNETTVVASANLPLTDVEDGQILYLKVEAEDAEGNVSDPVEFTCVADAEAPKIANAAVALNEEERFAEVSWDGGMEEDLVGYYIYRMPKGGDWKLVDAVLAVNGQEQYQSVDYSLPDTAGVFTYKIQAVDAVGNVSEMQAGSVILKDATLPSPVLNCENLMEIGVEYLFDLSDSTDNEGIVSYELDFGDGTSVSGTATKYTHVYEEIGAYTAALWAEDTEGNRTVVYKEITVRERSTLGSVTITVTDDSGKTISNAPVYFDLGSENQFIRYTNALGQVTVTAGVGLHTVGCFRSGYLPVKKDVMLLSGETVETGLEMVEEELVTGEFEITRMTLEEIVAAGIDITDPANQYIAKVEIRVTYGDDTVEETVLCSGEGEIIQGTSFTVGTGDNKRRLVPQLILPDDDDEDDSAAGGSSLEEATVVLLDLPEGVSALKEFFEVKLHIMNHASSEFSLLDNTVKLNLPGGLSLVQANDAEANTCVYIDEIRGQETETIRWIVRGDEVGEYYLSADFSATLSQFDQQVSAHFEAGEAIEVYGLSNCSLTITLPRSLDYAGNMEYTLKFMNEGSIDIYCPGIQLPDGSECTSMYYAALEGSMLLEDFPDTLHPGEYLELSCVANTGGTYYELLDWYVSVYSGYGLQVSVVVSENDYVDTGITVYEANTNYLLKNKELTLNGETIVTDAEGKLYVNGEAPETLTFEMAGYYDYVVDTEKILGDNGTHKISMTVVDEKNSPYISSLYFMDTSGNWKDGFSDSLKVYVNEDGSYYRINSNEEDDDSDTGTHGGAGASMDEPAYTFYAEGQWLTYGEGYYVLSQDADHKLTSEDGTFDAVQLTEVFEPGKTIYIYMVCEDGTTSIPKETKISVEYGNDLLALNGTTFKLGSALEVTIPDDFPVIGGNTFSIELDDSPLYVEVTDDVYQIGIGINSGDDGEYDLAKKYFEKITAASDAEKQYEIASAMCKRYGGVATRPWMIDTDFSYGLLGYIEGSMTSDGFVVTEGQIMVYLEFSGSLTKQLVYPPVFLSFKLGAKTSVTGTFSRYLADSSIPFTFELTITAEPYFQATGGVGVKDVVALELTGGVSTKVEWKVLDEYVKVTGSADVTVKGYVGPWTFLDKDLVSKETVLWETNTDKDAAAAAELSYEDYLALIYDAENYEAVAAYDYASGWLAASDDGIAAIAEDAEDETGSGDGENADGTDADNGTDADETSGSTDADTDENSGSTLLQDDVYPDGRQTLVEADGVRMLVWLSQDSSRAAQNSTLVVYSVYNEADGSWSTPKPVDDDGTADLYPSAAAEDGRIYVAWQNTSKELDDTETSLADLSKNTEIKTAVYDPESGAFTVLDAMGSQENVCVSDPDILSGDGQVAAVWFANSAQDIFGVSGTNSILVSWMTEDGWSEAQTVAEDLPMIASYDACILDGFLRIACSLDTDGDVSTSDDWEIYEYICSVNGEATASRLTENESADIRPTYGEESGTCVLYWSCGSELMKLALDGSGESTASGAATDGKATQVTTKYGTYLLWIGDSEEIQEARELYCAVLDEETGTYGSAVCVTGYGKYMTAFQASAGEDGEITLIYQARTLVADGDEVSLGNSGYYTATITPEADLCVSDNDNMSIQSGRICPGMAVEFSVLVENKGMFPADGYLLQVLDESGKAVCTKTVDTMLAGGQSEEITIPYLLPLDFQGQTYTIRAVLRAGTESNTDNNSFQLELEGESLTVQSIRTIRTGSQALCIVKVENNGAVDLEKVTIELREGEKDGTLVDTATIEGLVSGASADGSILIDMGSLTAWENGAVKLYFTVTGGENASASGAAVLSYNAQSPVEVSMLDASETEGGVNVSLMVKNEALTADEVEVLAAVTDENGSLAAYAVQTVSVDAGRTVYLTVFVPAEELPDAWSALAGVMVPVEEITLNISSAQLKTGESLTLEAAVLPEEATDTAVIWESSNGEVASVSADGQVTAIKAGEAEITCTSADGHGAQATCTVTVSAHDEHTWGEWEVIQESTCTTQGTQRRVCTTDGCGAVEEVSLPLAEHTLVHHDAVSATCTGAGNIEYWYCSVCGKYFSDADGTNEVSQSALTLTATGHKGTHVAEKAATCTGAGNIEYWYCPTCKKYFSDKAMTKEITAGSITVKATGHTASTTWTTTNAATCTTAGTKVQYCTKCGAVVNRATIAAIGHSYGEWTTTTEATALAEGTMTRTCSKCNTKETKSIAKLTPTIKVNATSIKLKKKQSTTALKVTGLASGDAVKSWKSSNTKIVTVTSKGKITAKNKMGTAYITITLKSGLTKKIKVTVQKSAVKTTKITVSSKKVSLKKGKTYTIKPTISPITSVQKVTYSSSNKKVATVTSKGKITAKKKGTATITVKSGSKSVKIKVTVK